MILLSITSSCSLSDILVHQSISSFVHCKLGKCPTFFTVSLLQMIDKYLSSFTSSLNFEGFQALFPDLMVNFQQTASCMDCFTPDHNYATEDSQVLVDLRFKPEAGQGDSAITIQRLIDANYPLEIIDKHCPNCSRRQGDDKQFMINRKVSAVPPVVVFAIYRQHHALADLEVEADRDITFYGKNYSLRAFNYHLGPSIDEGSLNFLI